jgi:sarcosine oxidase delta subunit
LASRRAALLRSEWCRHRVRSQRRREGDRNQTVRVVTPKCDPARTPKRRRPLNPKPAKPRGRDWRIDRAHYRLLPRDIAPTRRSHARHCRRYLAAGEPCVASSSGAALTAALPKHNSAGRCSAAPIGASAGPRAGGAAGANPALPNRIGWVPGGIPTHDRRASRGRGICAAGGTSAALGDQAVHLRAAWRGLAAAAEASMPIESVAAARPAASGLRRARARPIYVTLCNVRRSSLLRTPAIDGHGLIRGPARRRWAHAHGCHAFTLTGRTSLANEFERSLRGGDALAGGSGTPSEGG